MQLNFTITTNEQGVLCSGNLEGEDVFTQAQANLIAIGALEIAKNALLAARWGIELRSKPTATPLIPTKESNP